MNRWEDSVKKTLSNNDKECHCSTNQGLFVPNRQLSFIVAGLLFLFFSIFMAGYFLGKKNVIEQFSEKLQQDVVADQIYTKVISSTPENEPSSINTMLVTETEIVEALPTTQTINQEIITENVADIQETFVQRYYAQLIGFGTEKAAQHFVKKLATKGIDTEVRKRTSKTAQGRTSYWYQVVTNSYASKDDLSLLVDKIAKEENIRDICIRAC
jgi:cell division protein FtsN